MESKRINILKLVYCDIELCDVKELSTVRMPRGYIAFNKTVRRMETFNLLWYICNHRMLPFIFIPQYHRKKISHCSSNLRQQIAINIPTISWLQKLIYLLLQVDDFRVGVFIFCQRRSDAYNREWNKNFVSKCKTLRVIQINSMFTLRRGAKIDSLFYRLPTVLLSVYSSIN